MLQLFELADAIDLATNHVQGDADPQMLAAALEQIKNLPDDERNAWVRQYVTERYLTDYQRELGYTVEQAEEVLEWLKCQGVAHTVVI